MLTRDIFDEKILVLKNADVEDSKTVFPSYVDKAQLGQWILDSYLKQRTTVDESFKATKNGAFTVFFNDEKDESTGYLSDIYGYVGVLSLALRMNVKLPPELKKDLTDNICLILDYIDENGYTLYPYLSKEENLYEGGKLFGKKYPYIGAMTWALSFFTSVRSAVNAGIITLDDNRQTEIIGNIRRIIECFNRAFIRKDNRPMGWGFTEGCERSSLFFTYSVLEAYSDFEDNVYDIQYVGGDEYRTVKDEELLAAINKNRREDEPSLEEEWKASCFAVADHVWDVYHDVLKEEFVDDSFLDGFRTVKRDDILKAERSNALFNNIYLVSILLYGYVNKRNNDIDDVVMTMEAALQNVQRIYNQLRRTGMEYLVDTYIIPFKSKHREYGNAYMGLNYKSLIDATLIPMLVKANNIIAFYISQYPVKEMGTLFRELFKNKQVDEWTWESKGYDVKITERYIEAIADFYNYHEAYEHDYAENKSRSDAITKALIDKAVARDRKRALKEAEQQAERRIAEETKKIKDACYIENAVRNFVDSSVTSTLTASLDRIATKLAEPGAEFTTGEAQLFAAIEKLVNAYILAKFKEATADPESFETVAKHLKKDTALFMTEWTERLVHSGDVLTKLLRGDN